MHIFQGGSFVQLPNAHRGFTDRSTYGATMANNKIYVIVHSFHFNSNSTINEDNSCLFLVGSALNFLFRLSV
jgi:hypothetical protein